MHCFAQHYYRLFLYSVWTMHFVWQQAIMCQLGNKNKRKMALLANSVYDVFAKRQKSTQSIDNSTQHWIILRDFWIGHIKEYGNFLAIHISHCLLAIIWIHCNRLKMLRWFTLCFNFSAAIHKWHSFIHLFHHQVTELWLIKVKLCSKLLLLYIGYFYGKFG